MFERLKRGFCDELAGKPSRAEILFNDSDFFWVFLCSEIGAFSFYFEVTANMKVLFS